MTDFGKLFNKKKLATARIRKIKKKYKINVSELARFLGIKRTDLERICALSVKIFDVSFRLERLMEIIVQIQTESLFRENYINIFRDKISSINAIKYDKIPRSVVNNRKVWIKQMENEKKRQKFIKENRKNRKCCNCGNPISDWAEPYQNSKNKYMCSFACYKNQLDYIFYLNLKFAKELRND